MFFKKFQKSKDEICPWPLCTVQYMGDTEGEGDKSKKCEERGTGMEFESKKGRLKTIN
jgi:hypothetical protein